jgi:hypothetical protein
VCKIAQDSSRDKAALCNDKLFKLTHHHERNRNAEVKECSKAPKQNEGRVSRKMIPDPGLRLIAT